MKQQDSDLSSLDDENELEMLFGGDEIIIEETRLSKPRLILVVLVMLLPAVCIGGVIVRSHPPPTNSVLQNSPSIVIENKDKASTVNLAFPSKTYSETTGANNETNIDGSG